MSTPTIPSPKSTTCAVVGVGVLGTSLCQQILASPDWSHVTVTGITKSTTHHEEIRQQVGNSNERFRLITNEQRGANERFDHVVFCAPPSGFDDYPAAVRDAVEHVWAGPEQGGVFVFTSSGAVYGPGEQNVVTETSPLADPKDSPRVARLLYAEEACLKAGGCCLRLAGLYNLQRGPHSFWLMSGKGIAGSPDGIINMLHYDDAAGACLAALQAGPAVCRGKAFLISDGHPLTRRQICEVALQTKLYEKYGMPEFLDSSSAEGGGSTMSLGKIYDGSASNAALGWQPKYESFAAFMRQSNEVMSE